MKPQKKINSKLLWSILFVLLAAANIWAVTSQSKDFSPKEFLEFIGDAHPGYMLGAVLCMLGFVFFEGTAITDIARSFGYKCSLKNGFSYSATDIYFSSITPSATGGQPACGYFMVMDGMSLSFTTFCLITNLVLYSLAIIVIGLLCVLITPELFFSFGILSRVLIVVGIAAQVGLSTGLILLLRRENLVKKIMGGVIAFMRLIRLKHLASKLENKLDHSIKKYAGYSTMLAGKKMMLVRVFFWNFLQRVSQIAVTAFVLLACGGTFKEALMIWFLQSYVVIASNCVPIPGAMGVTDYLMLDSFSRVIHSVDSTSLELLSRSVSFYFCILICAVTAVIKYTSVQIRKRKDALKS